MHRTRDQRSPPPSRCGGGGISGRVFGARELASVSSVHSWTVDTGVALLWRTPATFSVPVGAPSSSLYARRGDGVGESSERFFLCSRLSLPPHLCTLDEVVRGGGSLVARSVHASSVHSWTVDTGVALLRRTPATFSVPVGSPSSSLYARRGDGVGESSECFFYVLGCLSRLISARSTRW